MKKKIDYNITGAAGEFFVAAELSRRGFIATLTLKNTPLVDVIATNFDTGITLNIQVKTRSERNNQGWILSDKVEKESIIKNHYFIFVNLEDKKNLPEYYIIPADVFAKYQQQKHKKWLSGVRINGTQRKDSSLRNFKPSTEDASFADMYKNNWSLLTDLLN